MRVVLKQTKIGQIGTESRYICMICFIIVLKRFGILETSL